MELDGVELVDLHFPTTDPLYLRDLKRTCTELQLTIAAVAVTNDFGLDQRRVVETEKVKQWCDVAAYLGAPIVRVFAGWIPQPSSEPHSGRVLGLLRKVMGAPRIDERRLWSNVTAALRSCADHAAERGVVLAVQNNRSDGIIGSVADLRQTLRDVGSPWLRVCLDPADLADRTYADVVMPSVVQVHARLRDVSDDGSDAGIAWPEILRFLRQNAYRGFVLADYEGVEPPESAVPRAVRYLRGMLHLLQRQQLLAESAPSHPEPTTTGDAERPIATSEPSADDGVAAGAGAPVR
jgi:sugar phosphate isomerase/epimerase